MLSYGSTAGPLADPAYFPNTFAEPYWNASDNSGDASTAWTMDEGSGAIANGDVRDTPHPVMLVRGKKALGSGSTYVLSPNGREAADESPGAVVTRRRCVESMAWSGTICEGTPLTFTPEQALAYATSMSAATGKSWHVPNVKELNWVVRREASNPAIDTTEFPGIPAALQCTSTPDVRAQSRAWMVDFSIGRVVSVSRASACVLRLARWSDG
jgi:hypothetical protein